MPLMNSLKEQNNKFQAEVLKTDHFERQHLTHIQKSMQYIQEPVLDVGCGQGLFQEFLRSQGLEETVGIDLSLDMIAIARGRGLVAEVMDIQDFPFMHQRFRTIISSHSLEHILHLRMTCNHLTLLCTGHLIIIVPKEDVTIFNQNPLHVNLFTCFEDVTRLFPDFDVVEQVEESGDMRIILKKKEKYDDQSS